MYVCLFVYMYYLNDLENCVSESETENVIVFGRTRQI